MIKNFIFFPQSSWDDEPRHWNLQHEEVNIPVKGEVSLNALWFPGKNKDADVILLSHGNAGNISHRLFKVVPLLQKGFQVLLYDYRGYGKSSGEIEHQKDLYQDAEAAYQWLVTNKKILPEKIIVYGESIGCAPTLELAAHHKVKAVILESPFTSLKELGKLHYPFLPSFLAQNFQFNNREKIKKVTTPLLHIHARNDTICPYSLGISLFEEANEPKEIFVIDQANHNDLVGIAGAEYFDRIEKFVAGITND